MITFVEITEMKRFIIQYWWALPVLMALLMVLDCLIMIANLPIIEAIVDWLGVLVGITILVSWVILLINKQWKKCLYSFLITILAICALSIPVGIISLYAPSSDNFGRRHKIPDGIEYNIPFDEYSDSTVVIDSLDTDTYLQIRNDIQGGIYRYDFYYGPLPAGELFLRCYEVTKNIQLSAKTAWGDRIYESSKVAIDSTSSFSKKVNQQRFTIYEGDWGDYYAARIEVWHKDAKTGKETKLMEKVYRVEGWMR